MKKISLLFFTVLLLTGCTGHGVSLVDTKKTSSGNNNLTTNQSSNNATMNTNLSIEQQADLVSQYSQAIIKTNRGDIQVKFHNNESPITVNNFLNLAQQGFYNGTKFHRVIKDFMIQGGDPNSKTDDWSTHGTGGPGYSFADEINNYPLVQGSLAMANAGPNTNGSQFFIVTAPETAWLDGLHTNFGQVVSGLNIVQDIENINVDHNDHPLEDIVIIAIELIK